jgi:hypothetical protein
METAYNDIAGRITSDAKLNLGAGALGGNLVGGPSNGLTNGVYTFTSDVELKGNVHFDGSDTDIFIIQITGSLKQYASYQVILDNGALAESKRFTDTTTFFAVITAITNGHDQQQKKLATMFCLVSFFVEAS